MDRMITGLLIFGMLVVFGEQVFADEWNYVPAYAASPSASATPMPTPMPTPTPTLDLSRVPTVTGQPQITCNLKTTLPADMAAPVEAVFVASGTISGNKLELFRYIFGDGESATASGEVRHTYPRGGSYQVRVIPVIDGDVEVPICKTKIVVAAGETVVDPMVESTPSAVATDSAGVTVQPKTGPSKWYWVSMLVLFGVWLGAIRWYQKYLA